MQIKSILAGAASALAATMGSASAGERLTLSAIPAEPLTAAEMELVQGKWTIHLDRNDQLGSEPFFPGGANHSKTGDGPEPAFEVDRMGIIAILIGL